MKKNRSIIPELLGLALLFLFCLFSSQNASARSCPVNVTDAIQGGPVPNVDPPAPQGTPELDIDSVFSFVQQNDISSIKELLDVLPDHMKGHYALVEKSRALHTSTPTKPSIMMYSVDGTFLLNIVVDPDQDRYEVLDMAYLQDDDDGARNGEWRFASLDFRQTLPVLTDDTNTDINSTCFDCHGNPSEGKPPRPIWGNYLAWNDILGDIKGESSEKLEQPEINVLTNIKVIQATHDRYHTIKFGSTINVGQSFLLPDLNYPYALTNSNMEIGTALVKSIATRMKKSSKYNGLREELFLVSYCQGNNQLDETDQNQIRNVLAESGVNVPMNEQLHRKHFYQAMGLNYEHETSIPNLSTDPFQNGDDRYNLVSGDIFTVVDGYIIHELMNESPQFKTVLDTILDLPQYSPCNEPFGKLSDNLSYRHHQLYVLKGIARQEARENYFASQNFRYTQSFDEGKEAICGFLKENISTETIGNTTPTPTPTNDPGSLTNGQSISVSQATKNAQDFYFIDVPAGSTSLKVQISGGSGDADLYVLLGSKPNLSDYTCRPFRTGNEETCTFDIPKTGRWYFMLESYRVYSGVAITATYE